MIGFTNPIRRRVDVNGESYRVEMSAYGIAVYRHRARRPLYEVAWERLVSLGERKASSGKRGLDTALHIQRIYIELDALLAEVREVRREIRGKC